MPSRAKISDWRAVTRSAVTPFRVELFGFKVPESLPSKSQSAFITAFAGDNVPHCPLSAHFSPCPLL